jgi:membrane dipeptidase
LLAGIVPGGSAPAARPQGGQAATRPSVHQQEGEPVQLTEQARRIHRSAIVIDGHNDLPDKIREKAGSSFDRLDLRQAQADLHTDIPRLRRGGLGAQFWSAYVPPETARTGGAARHCLEQMDLIRRMARRYPEHFEMAYSADDIVRIRRDDQIACLIGIEGGHAIENSLAVLRMFYALGARYLTLTHAETHDWADSATDEPRHGGLSPFGEEVVLEMNRLGMLADISHISAEAMRDTLRVSRAPVIASHSSAYTLAPHPRNVPDDVLRLIADNGGVVMANFYSGFIEPEGARVTQKIFEVARELRAAHPDKAEFEQAMKEWERQHPFPAGTVHTLIDHIDHIVKVAGIDHVGLGSDYDGVSVLPRQLEDVSCFPYITQELLNRGYSEQDIQKILGGNLLRALRQAEAVAHDWKE